MRNIASKDVLNELIKDYFVTHLISDDSDSSGDVCDVESEPGSELEVSRTVITQ